MPIAKIESLDNNARGIAHNKEGKTIFIEDALPNEIVEYAKFKDKKKYELAHLIKILKPAFSRVEPKCKYFGICGGCAMQHIEIFSQIATKQRILEDNLWHIGKVKSHTMLAPITGPAWNYRHKARLSVRKVPKKGGMLIGFHERKSSYIADMQTCEILPVAISQMLLPLRELIGSLSLAEKIPQIEVSVGEFVIALVLRILEPLTENDKLLIQNFADKYNNEKQMQKQNQNQKQQLVFYLQEKGPDSVYLFYPPNPPKLSYLLPEFNLEMQFQPTDFTQVNHQINTVMIRQALDFLRPNAEDQIADFFCGLGNFTLPIAKSGAKVFGIEGNFELVKRANFDAETNNLADLAKFKVANLFKFDLSELQNLIAENQQQIFNKWLIDPPREGAVELVKALPETEDLKHLKPKLIVYISCNPATLARDAGILVHLKNYELCNAGIINMFPHTAHVESMAVFKLKE